MSLPLDQTHSAVAGFIAATRGACTLDRHAAVAAVVVTWLHSLASEQREMAFVQAMVAIMREAGFASAPRAHANDCEAP